MENPLETKDIITEDEMIMGLGSDMFKDRPPHKESVAKILAIIILLLLGGLIVVHYATTVALMFMSFTTPPIDQEIINEDLNNLETIFSTVLPVLSGLSGAVVTYYFTREKN